MNTTKRKSSLRHEAMRLAAMRKADAAAGVRGIVRIDPYNGTNTKIGWRGECGHEWNATPKNVANGSGCPKCSGRLGGKERADAAAALRGITRTGPYVNTMTKTVWKCTNEHEWMASPNSLVGGSGCPHCAGLSCAKERTDATAALRGITRTGPYINKSTKTGWKCEDGHEWEAVPGSIARGIGCPHCAGLLGGRERLDSAANARGITRTGPYVNSHTITSWRGECGHEWEARPSTIGRGGGCPHCVKNSCSKERTDAAGAERGIIRIGEWVNGQTKTSWRGECGHEWEAAPANILQGHNCPTCARNSCAKERADAAAALRGITRIGPYINSRTKTSWKCTNDHEWETAPGITIQGHNCPTCTPGGYSPNKPGSLYVLASECGGLMKIGITNNHQVRFVRLVACTPFGFNPIHIYQDENGAVAQRVEREYHQILKAHNAGLTGFEGASEWFKATPPVLEFIALL